MSPASDGGARAKKRPRSDGNGINHPNDFGHRVYAQVILALLVGGESLQTIS
jgi:hypothetical protein